MRAMQIPVPTGFARYLVPAATGITVGLVAILLFFLEGVLNHPSIIISVFVPNILLLIVVGAVSLVALRLGESKGTISRSFSVTVTALALVTMAAVIATWYRPLAWADVLFFLLFFRQIFLFPFILLGAVVVAEHLHQGELKCRHCCFYLCLAGGLQLITLNLL